MKKSLIIFLKVAAVLIGIVVLMAMAWFPLTEGRAVNLDLFGIYSDPFIIYIYIASIPFFVGLYQILKLLINFDQNKIYSLESINSLKIIKKCAIVLGVAIAIAVVYINLFHDKNDDPVGFIVIGSVLMLVSVIGAFAAGLFEIKLQQLLIKMQNQFHNRGNLVRLWRIRSDELYKAAESVWFSDVVEDDPSKNTTNDCERTHFQYRPACLLMGLCIEVLLKGLIIKNRPLVKGEDYPKDLSYHKLLKLFEIANINYNDREKRLLERLTVSIEWMSKYPIPKVSARLDTDLLVRNDCDFTIFKEIRNRILEKYN